MRLIIRFLVNVLMIKVLESKYKKVIIFCLYFGVTGVGLYTIWYNLRDFGHLTATQIIGLIILIPLTLLFLLGTVFSTGVSGIDLATILSRNAGKIDENHPMYQARYIGKTIFEEKECDVYLDKKGNYFLSGPHAGFKKYGRFYIRYAEPKELGEVYNIRTYCHYKGHTFPVNRRQKDKRKSILLYTIDGEVADELSFSTVGKSEYELTVPIEEVQLEDVKNIVDLG